MRLSFLAWKERHAHKRARDSNYCATFCPGRIKRERGLWFLYVPPSSIHSHSSAFHLYLFRWDKLLERMLELAYRAARERYIVLHWLGFSGAIHETGQHFYVATGRDRACVRHGQHGAHFERSLSLSLSLSLSRVKNDVLPKNGLTHTVLAHSLTLAERNERRPRKIISKIGCCTIYRRTGGRTRSLGREGG